jgi:hypothetical protein
MPSQKGQSGADRMVYKLRSIFVMERKMLLGIKERAER